MIRIDRGAEPGNLPGIRDEELKRVGAIAASRAPTGDDIGARYVTVRDVLRARQFGKCAYCEWREQPKRNDLEHYRPKSRYWWLAWTWENFLFACRNCNQFPAKGDQFPLELGCRALNPHEQPPGEERPLLIDPASEDPLTHIQFVPERHKGHERWVPRARGGSERGLETIRILHLDDADNLLTVYQEHVRDYIEPARQRIAEAIAADDGARVRDTWKREVCSLLSPSMPLVALSRDALDHFFPLAVRQRWGLELDELRHQLFVRAIEHRNHGGAGGAHGAR
ncbi:hypothetical protein F0U61_00865 [Archangium violaceum]|uniref:hypothetical protein n=1 Tax=Archangium violaceum TaxID=83451 RepID=UPI002B2E45ED|nr:hypothetical protein F0U61_00865 [Archangium violaceum]